jgi:hypothetical protein
MTIKKTFRYHVDASLFAFKWADAQYIDVEYCATKGADGLVVVVTNISGDPSLLGMIAVHDNWLRMLASVKDAAVSNAGKYFNNVHPTILQSILPHIPY